MLCRCRSPLHCKNRRVTEATGAHEHTVSITVDESRSRLQVEPCDDVTYGAAAELDRWDGEVWVHTHNLATYRDRGEFVSLGSELRVKLIGYGGRGTLNLSLPPLGPGRYRVRKRFILPGEPSPHRESMIATTEFEVGGPRSA